LSDKLVSNRSSCFPTSAHVQPALAAAFVLGALCASGTAGAQWSVEAQATRLRDSNASRGQLAGDVLADSVTRVSASASREVYAAGNSSIAVNGDAAVAEYERFRGLSNASLGATITARSKLGVGLTAPWLELSASAARDAYRATQRNGYRYTAALTGGRRFGESFDAQVGARYDRRATDYELPDVAGTSGRAWDLQGRTLFAQANLAVSDALAVNAGLSVRRGDAVSTALETPVTWAAANAVAPDFVFGEERYAYRLSGSTAHSGSITLSWALNAHSSINGSMAGETWRARDGFGYRSNVMAIQYVYSR
jgi:hypothetical protein